MKKIPDERKLNYLAWCRHMTLPIFPTPVIPATSWTLIWHLEEWVVAAMMHCSVIFFSFFGRLGWAAYSVISWQADILHPHDQHFWTVLWPVGPSLCFFFSPWARVSTVILPPVAHTHYSTSLCCLCTIVPVEAVVVDGHVTCLHVTCLYVTSLHVTCLYSWTQHCELLVHKHSIVTCWSIGLEESHSLFWCSISRLKAKVYGGKWWERKQGVI